MSMVLVLNQNYYPIGVIDWRKSIVLFFKGAAEIVDEYPDKVIRTVSKVFKMPSVIRLVKYVHKKIKGLRFNKLNIWLRDKGVCQYCGKKVSQNKATYDHVHPKSKGGLTNWYNIVTACSSCNQKKDCKTVEESGMKLLSIPTKPNSLPVEYSFMLALRQKRLPDSWKTYVRIEDETRTDN